MGVNTVSAETLCQRLAELPPQTPVAVRLDGFLFAIWEEFLGRPEPTVFFDGSDSGTAVDVAVISLGGALLTLTDGRY